MKQVLELNNIEAKTLFLKEESFCDISLPDYFSFNEILNKIDRELIDKNLSDFIIKSPRVFDDVNYKILSNKDGKFAWRPFQLINPAIYVSLVHTITQKDNWKTLKKRFKSFQKNKKIECHSLPAISEIKTKSNKTVQILNWWQKIEQRSIVLSLDFKYVLHSDIADCYSSIYTHSIPWAIHTKEEAKINRKSSLLGNAIDNHLQDMSHGQTNGIPQGSVLMDFIAEIILGDVDLLLTEKLKENNLDNYHILRYRDDYRIFTNNSFEAEQITKELSEILSGIGLKLNAEKTLASDDIIKSSIKADKRYWISNKIISGSKQKWLIHLYLLSEKFPNSGTIDSQMREFLGVLEKSKKKDHNIISLITIVTEIALRNPRVVPISIAILSLLISKINSKKNQLKVIRKIKIKFKANPNSSLIMIWFQRLNLKFNKKEEYKEVLCHKVLDQNIKIWNTEWLKSKIKKIVNETPIIKEAVIEKTKKKISKSEIKKILKSIPYIE